MCPQLQAVYGRQVLAHRAQQSGPGRQQTTDETWCTGQSRCGRQDTADRGRERTWHRTQQIGCCRQGTKTGDNRQSIAEMTRHREHTADRTDTANRTADREEPEHSRDGMADRDRRRDNR